MSRYLLLIAFLFVPYISHGADAVCTLEYAPVCGLPPMPECPAGMACIQALPPPKTYDNICMMRAAGASLNHDGDCNISQSTAPLTPSACTKEYEPVCGMVEVQCITAPCYPVRTDFANLCLAKAAGATEITGGTCIMSESTPVLDPPALPALWTPSDYVSWAYEGKLTRYDAL
jgi:hypothetical protein